MKRVLLGVFSITPVIGLIVVNLADLQSNETLLAISEHLRVVAAVTLLGMMAYFIWYTHRSGDPRFDEKKSVWTVIILLGNVFAVPLFWYLFIRTTYQGPPVTRVGRTYH